MLWANFVQNGFGEVQLLSIAQQQEILREYARLFESRQASLSAEQTSGSNRGTPPNSPAPNIKRELESPETPDRGGSKKVMNWVSLSIY